MIGTSVSHYPPEADQPLADKILEKLGEGGMGIVYKAHDTKSQNHPRALYASGCDFADPAVFTFFVSRCCLSGWRDSKYRRY